MGVPVISRVLYFIWARVSCIMNSSSKPSLLRDISAAWVDSGKWIFLYAYSSVQSSKRTRILSGRKSSICSEVAASACVMLVMTICAVSPSVRAYFGRMRFFSVMGITRGVFISRRVILPDILP